MQIFSSKPWLKAFSGLSINISAGWFGALIISPNFGPFTKLSNIFLLTLDALAGILFLLLTVKIEEKLEK